MGRISASAAAALGLVLLQAPAPASAASCDFDAGTATVTVVALPNEQASLYLSGSNIYFEGVTCEGATVFNTDTIVITDPSPMDGEGGNLFVTRPEAFAPGDTPEPGGSDEIEWMVDLGPGRDGVAFFPDQGPHFYALGGAGVNFNAGEADGIDVDMTLTSVDFLHFFLNAEYGGDSADVIRGDGVAATGGTPYPAHFGVSAGPGDDLLIGGMGTNTFFPMQGNDTVDTGGDDDVVYDTQDDGNDIISGGDGNDSISGGPGNDIIFGGPGNDSFSGGLGDDTLDGQGGQDSESGDEGLDLVTGGPGADYSLRGGPDNDTIKGQGGKDFLRGQGGNDHLNGGPQYDVCKGGIGMDTFANCEKKYQ